MAVATGPAPPLVAFVPPPPDPTPTFPPLEMNFHPDVWRHEKVVGRPNVVERVVEVETPQQRPEQVVASSASVSAQQPQTTTETVRPESFCECIWRIFKDILLLPFYLGFLLGKCIKYCITSHSNPTPLPPTPSLAAQQSTPQQTNRRREWQVTHEITETFTCQDRSRISINDIRLILAHIYAPYKPLDSGPDVVQRACEIFGNVQQVDTFTIVAKRTTANWLEPSRLEVSYNIGQGPVTFPVLTRDVRFFADRNDVEYHNDRAPNRLMQPGAIFVLPYDGLRRIDESPIVTHVRCDKMSAALRWLGYDPAGFSILRVVLDSWLSGNSFRPYCSYQERQACADDIIHFEHSGYWIISLYEDNGRKSIKCILQQPGGGAFPDATSVQQQLQQLLTDARNGHAALRQMNIQPFMSPGDSQIGYEIRLPQQ